MAYLHGSALVTKIKPDIGKNIYSSMCQAYCVTRAGTGAVGDYDGDGAADAQDGWKKAKAKGKVVLAKDINNLKDVPAGTFCYWEGGSHGYGHVAISIGNGRIQSTDAPTWGRIGQVDISWISQHWGNGLKFVGYVVTDGNGHKMVDTGPPKPTDRMDPASYGPGKTGPQITWLGERLVLHGFGGAYDVGPGPRWGEADRANVRAFQRAQGWTGDNADGYPGKETLKRLAADPVVTVPPSPPADSFDFRLSVLNRNARYWADAGLKPYTQRVNGLAAKAAESRASVDLGCEAGGYDDGKAYDKARGWAGRRVDDDKPKKGDSFVLHGGAVPVCTAIDIDPDKRTFVATGQFTTAGSRNKWATWGVLEDQATGIRILVGVTHLEFEPKGFNTASHWGNKRREDQLNAVFAKLEPIAAQFQVAATIVGGDMNGLKSDPYDGPGKAATKHGYSEATSGHIDRIFYKGNVTVKEKTAIKAYPYTDSNHYVVGALLTIDK